MYPVRRVIELPIGMPVALLQRVPGAHAQLKRNHVRLTRGVRKMVRRSGEPHCIAVASEDCADDVVVVTHGLYGGRVGGGNHAEVRAASGERLRVRWCDAQVVDHPALVPAALIVDDEKQGDVRKDIDEGANVIRVRRKAGFGLQNLADGTDGRQTAVGPGRGQHRGVIDAGKKLGEGVRLEAVRIEQVILKKLARLIGLRIRLSWQLTMRTPRLFGETVAQGLRQVTELSPVKK